MTTATLPKPETQTFKRQDIYQTVTNTIIQQLESGTVPWQKPWVGDDSGFMALPRNQATGKLYRGINILLLWSSAIKHGYQEGEWGTFKQWQEKKKLIRKGEKGSTIIYYDTFEKEEEDGEIKKIPFIKTSVVFNRCQLANYEPPVKVVSEHVEPLWEKIYPIEEFIENTKAVIEHKDEGAYYSPSEDKIVMPHPENFVATAEITGSEAYYSTLFHELTHWTGNKNRLDRTNHKEWGDSIYAHEELIAELGAAFICAGMEIATIDKGGHAGYIEHWLKVLKEDKKFIFTAASEASKAVDYLNSLQPKPE